MKRTIGASSLVIIVACGSAHPSGSTGDASRSVGDAGTPGSPHADGGMAVRAADGAVSSAAFSVNIDANDVELCAGECADLTVVDRNSIGAIAYAWDDALPPAATQHVCPTATTSYRVTATSSLPSGEFAQQMTASDGLTVSVRDCSMPAVVDDGVLCEVRHRFDLPLDQDTSKTTKPWVAQQTWTGTGALAATPDGGAYLVGTFSQELDLGAGRILANAAVSGFLHKLDANCAPVRTQLLSPLLPGELLQPMAVAVDGQGNVYVASGVGPAVDLNPFLPGTIRWTTDFLFEKFAPDGQSLYRSNIPVGLGAYVMDLEVDDAGRLYVSGIAPSSTNLGSGLPIGISPTAFHTFALALDAQGHYRAQAIDTGATQIEASAGAVYTLTNDVSQYDFIGVVFGGGYGAVDYGIAGLDPDSLAQVWKVPLQYEQEGQAMAAEGLGAGGVAVVVLKDAYTMEDASAWQDDTSLLVKRYAADGTLRSNVTLQQQHQRSDDVAPDGGVAMSSAALNGLNVQYLRESGQGSLVMNATFYSSVELGGVTLSPPPAPNLSGTNLYAFSSGNLVAKVSSDDRIQWVRGQSWGTATTVGGLAATPSGEVFVTGLASVPGGAADSDEQEFDLVVRKLRAD